MTNAEHIRMRRAKAKAKGMCGECCARDAKPGRSTCVECLARHALAVKRLTDRAKAGSRLCTACGYRKRRPGMRTCEGCATASKRASEKRKRRGICTKCRWPADPGTSLCQWHHQDNRRRVRAWSKQQPASRRYRARSDRKAA